MVASSSLEFQLKEGEQLYASMASGCSARIASAKRLASARSGVEVSHQIRSAYGAYARPRAMAASSVAVTWKKPSGVRSPVQKDVWIVAKAIAQTLARKHPELITAEYRIAKRPAGRVLVDYNQNAWGRTLASVYSVRPKAGAPVSMPVTWKEIEKGITIEQFHLRNAPQRVAKMGDLWKPLTLSRGRCSLEKLMKRMNSR